MRKFLPFILILMILSAAFSPVIFNDGKISTQKTAAQVFGTGGSGTGGTQISGANEPEVNVSGASGVTTGEGVLADGKYYYTETYTDGKPYKNFGPFNDSAACEAARNSAGNTPGLAERSSCVQYTANNSNPDDLPECGMMWMESGTFYGCVIQAVYYAVWMPTSFLAALAGKFLDYLIAYSIKSSSYSQSSFVYEGWRIVRDFANIAFIFTLLYIALRTILNLSGAEGKRAIVMVIIMALLINFSLFFTRVVVDGTNILAGVMYNNISATTIKDGVEVPVGKGDIGEQKISEALVNKFDPQKIFDQSELTFKDKNGKEKEALRTPFLITIILSSIVNIVMIYIFFSVAFIFVARVLGLMIAMIFSPFAFISLAVPGGGKFFRDWGWDKWFANLISLAILAPIFIFFLYLIIRFLDTGLIKNMAQKLKVEGTEPSSFTLANFMAVVLPFALVMGLLFKAKSLAQEYGGEIGAAVNRVVGTAAGLAGGVALGATAFAGRAVVGRLATRAATAGGEGGAGAAGTGPTRVPLSTTPTPKPPAPLTPYSPGRAPFIPRGGRYTGGPVTFARPEIGATPGSPLAQTEAQRLAAESRTEATTPAQIFETPETRLKERAAEEKEKVETEERMKNIGLVMAPATAKIPAAGAPAPVTTPPAPTPGTTPPASAPATAPVTPPTAPTTPSVTPGAQEYIKRKKLEAQVEKALSKKSAEDAEKEAEKEGFRKQTLKDMAAAAPQSVIGIRSGKDIKNMLGKQAFNLANYLGKSSFDLRDTKLMKLIGQKTGLDFGKAGGKGGWQAMQNALHKKELAYAESLETSGKELENLHRLEGQYKDITFRQSQMGGKKDPALDKAVRDAKSAFEKEEGKMKNLDTARRYSYAQSLEKGPTLLGSRVTKIRAANDIRNKVKSKSDSDKVVELIEKLTKTEGGKAELKEAVAKKPEPETAK